MESTQGNVDRNVEHIKDEKFWREFDLAAWRRLPREMQVEAVGILRSCLGSWEVESLSSLANSGPGWFAPFHFGLGMRLRNLLRTGCPPHVGGGIEDGRLPPNEKGEKNWDDCYVAVVEVAVMAGMYKDLPLEERI